MSNLRYQNPDIWRFKSFGPIESQKMFILKVNAAHSFFNIKKILREHCFEKNYVLAESYLDKNIIDFLISCKSSVLSESDVLMSIKEWLQEFDSVEQHDYKILLPISHYDFKNELNIANLKIIRINDHAFKKNFTSVNLPFFSSSDFIKTNDTDICAIVNVKAHDENGAKELAQEILDKFIFSIKLFDPSSFISTRKHSYKQLTELTMTHDLSKQTLSSGGNNFFICARTIPNESFYLKLNTKWEKLVSFLYSEHLTMFQKSILASLHWFGSVDNLRDSNVKKFLWYLTGLEKLLLKNHEQQKAKKFGDHAAVVFSGDIKHTNFYKSYYEKRNEIVHDENITIYDNDVDTLRFNLRNLLLDMIENSQTCEDIDSYYKKKYNLDL